MKRSHSSKLWLMRHVNDPFVKRSKAEGFRSRAIYKLKEIDEKDRLIRPGAVVVDLGAAPGGWSQHAASRVGARGRVVAIDLLDMGPVNGVTFIKGDFSADSGLAEVEKALAGAPVDVVLSDMAPNISGIMLSDQARALALVELALDFALSHLKPGGTFLVKTFQGEGFDDTIKAMRAAFTKVHVRKPEASRDESNEVFLLGLGAKPRPAP
jgi:23S rRNA (uridine2552-2'-O)-methyltransferase